MRMEGRIEKRAVAAVPLILMAAGDQGFSEQVTTENLSSQGARVISKRPWEPGEQVRIVTLTGEYQRPARVIYVRPLLNHTFRVGLQYLVNSHPPRNSSWVESPNQDQ
jgi:hypothetical protein